MNPKLSWYQFYHHSWFYKRKRKVDSQVFLIDIKARFPTSEATDSKDTNNWVLYSILHEKFARTVLHNCKLLTYPKLKEWAQWTSVIPDKMTASAYVYHIHPYTYIFCGAIAKEDAELPLLCIWPISTTVLIIYQSYLHDGI